MRIVINPGSNFQSSEAEAIDVQLAPQRLVVDGTEYDTRLGLSLDQVDGFVRDAKAFPHVVGSTAAELAELFLRIGKDDPEIVAIMSSRKLVQSYAAAVSATSTLSKHPTGKSLRISVIDTGATDVAAGLATLLACEGRRQGLSHKAVVNAVTQFCAELTLTFIPQTISGLVKSGRTTWLQGKVADLMGRSPVITFVDGSMVKVGLTGRATVETTLMDHAAKAVGTNRKVWLAVAHGNEPLRGRALLGQARSRFDASYALLRPMHSSIYLFGGAACLALCVAPVDRLGFTPSAPTFA